MTKLVLNTPRAFLPLLEPARYKAAYGGRGSGKSHFFAEMMMERGLMTPGFRGVCIREVQRSLNQSVKTLIEDKIRQYGLTSKFDIRKAEIRTPGDGLIIFQGMQDHTADSIKSLEGFDVAYVEEAQSLSEFSLELLYPTIRKPGSEMWFAWNPRHDTDAVDRFFRGPEPPEKSKIINVNWQDNPWFPEELRDDMERDYRLDPEKAHHIWGGGYQIISEGSYYARQLAELEKMGYVGNFPYDPDLPVSTSWDIGVHDYTSIWYFQEGYEFGKPCIRVIDFYETQNEGAEEIVHDAINNKPYTYKVHYLPHDVAVREWGAGARSRIQTLRRLGLNPIHRGTAQPPDHRINAVREILPRCRFDGSQAVHEGLKRLRNYSRKWNASLGTFQGPKKDGNDHAADAFGEYAINSPLRPLQAIPDRKKTSGYGIIKKVLNKERFSWM